VVRCQVAFAVAITLLSGCVEESLCTRPDSLPAIELSAVEAAPECRPLDAVEIRSGERGPTSHQLLRAYAAEHGANYVVLDAFGVIRTSEDILAVTLARLFWCPATELTWYRSAMAVATTPPGR
jgi:hypothetical protein